MCEMKWTKKVPKIPGWYPTLYIESDEDGKLWGSMAHLGETGWTQDDDRVETWKGIRVLFGERIDFGDNVES